MGDATPRLGIVKPNIMERDWADQLEAAFDTIDAKVAIKGEILAGMPTPNPNTGMETTAGAEAKVRDLAAQLAGSPHAELITRGYYHRETPSGGPPESADTGKVTTPGGFKIAPYTGDANRGPIADLADGITQILCQMPPTHPGRTVATLVTDDGNLYWLHGLDGAVLSLWVARPPAYSVPVLLDERIPATDTTLLEDGEFIWIGPHRAVKEKFLGQ